MKNFRVEIWCLGYFQLLAHRRSDGEEICTVTQRNLNFSQRKDQTFALVRPIPSHADHSDSNSPLEKELKSVGGDRRLTEEGACINISPGW